MTLSSMTVVPVIASQAGPAYAIIEEGVRWYAVLQTLIAILMLSASAQAADSDRGSNRDLAAKIEYCKNCHGSSGQGYRGFFPMPRLAGQQTEFFENQLRAYADRRRENKLMHDVSRTLNASTRAAIAAHFSNLNPKPLQGFPRELVATGRTIYEDGIPESNVPACLACHGPDARGQREIPRLAGHLHDYILNKLTNWTKERVRDPAGADASNAMVSTSHAMTRQQIAAVAAYLNSRQ